MPNWILIHKLIAFFSRLVQIQQPLQFVGIADVLRMKLAADVIWRGIVASFVNIKIGNFIIRFAA